MSRLHFAWATIAGKVFVEDWELQDGLREKFPNQFKIEDEEKVWEFTTEQEREVFGEIAEEKLVNIADREGFKFFDANIDNYESVYQS